MLKRALIASAVLAATSGVALANGGTFVPAPASNCGFYIGAGISGDFVKYKTDTALAVGIFDGAIVPGNLVDTFTRTSTVDLGSNGVDGNLFVGYGMTFEDHYTLGIEAFGDVSSNKAKYNVQSTDVLNSASPFTIENNVANASIKMNSTFGVALLPGFKMTDSTTLYGRIGWVYSRFKLSDNGLATFANPNTLTSTSFVSGALTGLPLNGSKNESGIQLGLGVDTFVTSNVSIRGEYDWERYGNFTVHSGVFAANNVVNSGISVAAVSAVKVKPTVQRVTLAAIYHFYS